MTSLDSGLSLRTSKTAPGALDNNDVIFRDKLHTSSSPILIRRPASRVAMAGSVEPHGYGDVTMATRREVTRHASVMDRQSDVTYKVLLLGDSGVGKTSLLRSLTGKAFNSGHMTTIGIDFIRKSFEVDGAMIQLQIWDTAGQERFRSISKLQYRGTKGLVLVYDVTKRQSFGTLSYWMKSIETEITDEYSTEPIPIILLANKTDLSEERDVSTEDGQKMAEKCDVEAYFEVSALTGDNVQAAFQRLAHTMIEIYDNRLMTTYQTPEEREGRQAVRISRVMDSLARNVDPAAAGRIKVKDTGPSAANKKPQLRSCHC